MDVKPTMDRRLLHPDANKAIAMSPDGGWLSYSHAPASSEGSWLKQSVDTVCFRIPAMRAPEWTGNWQDSLVVFDDIAA